MNDTGTILHGFVRNGVVVLPDGHGLPDGTAVKLVAEPAAPNISRSRGMTAEERAEFEAWDRAGDEAWARIDWGDEEGEYVRATG